MGNIAYIIKARVTLLRDLGPALVAVQCVSIPAGARDAASSHAASFRERACGGALSRASCVRVLGDLPRARFQPGESAGRQVPAAWEPGR